MRKSMIGQYRDHDERHLTRGANEMSAKTSPNVYRDRSGYGSLVTSWRCLRYKAFCFLSLGVKSIAEVRSDLTYIYLGITLKEDVTLINSSIKFYY